MLMLLIIAYVALPQRISGALLDVQPGIYGGSPVGGVVFHKGKMINVATSTEYPYMVELDLHGSQWCGGTIIREDAIVTAAHCFSSPHGIVVRAGHVYRESEKAPGLQKRRVTRVISHPKYSQVSEGKNKRSFNDIAILKLDEPFYITEFVATIKIPSENQKYSFAKEIGTILGWGTTETSIAASILQKAELVVMDKSECNAEISNYYDGYLCAIGKRRKGGLGGGDSGGPFVKHHSGHPEKDILLGVISFGYDKKHPYKICETVCDENSPSIMTNVAYFSKWISSTLSSL